MYMNLNDFEESFGRKLLIQFHFFKLFVFCFVSNLKSFVMFVVLDYLLKMKNCFFQELIVLLLTIKLTVEVTNLEMYFDVQRL